MTTTDTATGAALLRAIVDHPQDNDVRLVYADWLDDQGDAPRRCERCLGHGVISIDENPCPDCGGKGSLPGPNAERAEFVRVQVELARLNHAHHPVVGGEPYWWNAPSGRMVEPEVCTCWPLRRRERDLLREHRIGWAWPLLELVGKTPWEYGFSRGFLASVTLPARDFWGEPGRPGHGPAIVRAAPIETVEISDREPWFNGGGVCWFDAAREGPSTVPSHADVPHPLFTLLAGYNTSPSSKRWRPYPSEQAARAALSTAALAWARLPPCGECEGRGFNPDRHWPGDNCRPCHGLGRAERLDRIAPQG